MIITCYIYYNNNNITLKRLQLHEFSLIWHLWQQSRARLFFNKNFIHKLCYFYSINRIRKNVNMYRCGKKV